MKHIYPTYIAVSIIILGTACKKEPIAPVEFVIPKIDYSNPEVVRSKIVGNWVLRDRTYSTYTEFDQKLISADTTICNSTPGSTRNFEFTKGQLYKYRSDTTMSWPWHYDSNHVLYHVLDSGNWNIDEDLVLHFDLHNQQMNMLLDEIWQEIEMTNQVVNKKEINLIIKEIDETMLVLSTGLVLYYGCCTCDPTYVNTDFRYTRN